MKKREGKVKNICKKIRIILAVAIISISLVACSNELSYEEKQEYAMECVKNSYIDGDGTYSTQYVLEEFFVNDCWYVQNIDSSENTGNLQFSGNVFLNNIPYSFRINFIVNIDNGDVEVSEINYQEVDNLSQYLSVETETIYLDEEDSLEMLVAMYEDVVG